MMRNSLIPLGRNGNWMEPTLDRLLATAFDVPVWENTSGIQELDDRAEISIDVPGVRPDQLSVKVENRTLTIQAERDGRTTMRRSYTIGSRYDLSAVSARLDLGVLTISLPKSAEAQPREISITVN